ncbi:MAG: ATP-binding protein [Pseudomonas sp.]|nr:ATP-binding protein [Pseudomonas sp.]
MLQWKELIDHTQGTQITEAPAGDDLRLLQIYLCRLYLTPGYENIASLAGAEDSLVFMGLKLPSEHESSAGNGPYLKAIRARLRHLTAALNGTPELSFAPLLQTLVGLLKLSSVETKLLVFAILLCKHPKLRSVMRELDINGLHSAIAAMAKALREPARSLSKALLENDSLLCQVRLIESPSEHSDIWDLIDPAPVLMQLVVSLASDQQAPDAAEIKESLFSRICPVGPAPAHPVHAFGGVTNLQLLLDYLQQALLSRARGKNILLHGKPGTGKTELARTLAAHLSAPLYEVPTSSDNGSMTGRLRLDAAKLAQMFLQDRLGGILLFDEMEDAFRRPGELAKGWFNQLLEENKAPVIWISNDISAVDPAFLRRFGMIMEITGTGTDSHAGRMQQVLSSLPVSADWRNQAATQPWMTPALARNLAEVAALLPARQHLRNQARLEQLLAQRLSAMHVNASLPLLRPVHRDAFPGYRLDWLNTTPSLDKVERLLRLEVNGKICLYGPPGAGKTAYATELAKRLGRPLMLKSASDLLGKYVGETEAQIARMFDSAEREGAVLLLDEADSFLFNRSMARNTWEVSQSNEFMVRLERFNGVFLATTNRFETLDKAILRRFHLKVEFGYLRPEQLRELLACCVPDAERLVSLPARELERLHSLTPGLVKAALQGLRISGRSVRLTSLLQALQEEQKQQLDGVVSRAIGFVH